MVAIFRTGSRRRDHACRKASSRGGESQVAFAERWRWSWSFPSRQASSLEGKSRFCVGKTEPSGCFNCCVFFFFFSFRKNHLPTVVGIIANDHTIASIAVRSRTLRNHRAQDLATRLSSMTRSNQWKVLSLISYKITFFFFSDSSVQSSKLFLK